MKKLQFALISLILISSIGCGSTPVASEKDALSSPIVATKDENGKDVEAKKTSPKKPVEETLPGIYFKNKQTNKKLRIEDWKYMGFGNDLPKWVIPALEEDVKAIKEADESLFNSDIKILVTTGCNRDQAENAMNDLEKPVGYDLYDSFWVRVAPVKKDEQLEVNYISIAVYHKLLMES